jgi:hypothetical protein
MALEWPRRRYHGRMVGNLVLKMESVPVRIMTLIDLSPRHRWAFDDVSRARSNDDNRKTWNESDGTIR